MKRILIQRTVEEDLTSINEEVRWNPKVREQQYRCTALDLEPVFKYLLENTHTTGFLSWTVFEGDAIIGHVMGQQKMIRDHNCCVMGWNLHPEYWGRGVMSQALVQVFTEIFEIGTEVIVADRFEKNNRCGRLLNKFSFSEIDIGNLERIKIWISQRCPHRIVRSVLDLETWNVNVESLKDSLAKKFPMGLPAGARREVEQDE